VWLASDLLKTHSLQLAGQAGATLAITSNEDRNAAMLAVNEALGYRPFSRRVEWEWQADRDSCASADPA
jgi:surface antigen